MNSRAKGARFEREFAKLCTAHGYPSRRGTNSTGQADVIGLPGHHIEVKARERLDIWGALAQAERDAAEHEIPLVAFKRNRTRWYVAVPAERYLRHLPFRVLGDLPEEG